MVRERQVSGSIGVAVIGSGTIGRLRAENVHRHPSVGFLAVCDVEEGKARALAHDVSADAWSTSAAELIARDDVDAVIVATTEDAHFEPSMLALQARKPVLVEKPFTIDAEEGAKLIAAAEEYGVGMWTGFTQRFRRPFLALKEHKDRGHLGRVNSATASILLTQAVARAVISRAGTTTPAINTLTYCVDLMHWMSGDDRPVRVYAQGATGKIGEEFGVVDSTWAVVTFASGMVVQYGVSWELPEFHPAYVASMEVSLFGSGGSLSVKDDHRENLLVSHIPVPSPYTPDVAMNVALLGSAMPGDWSQGEYFGAMRDETQAFLNSVGTGRPDPILATGADGLNVLAVCRAIDESVTSGRVIDMADQAWA